MKLVSICLIAAATSNAANAFSQHAFFTKPSASFFLTTNTRCRGSTKDDDCSNQSMQDDRRAFLLASTAALASGIVTSFPSQSSAATVDYKAVAADISDLVIKNPDWGPTLVRLAWHSSGTYDKMKNDGGSRGGTIRFKEELAHGANAGLAAPALEWLEPVHAKYEGLSYADLYTLAGVASIRMMGGPTIPWSSGRVDELDKSAVTPDGRLPSADSGPPGADPSDAAHLRTIFYRMGFNDQEIVALSGAHALGRCHPTASGYDGPWTFTPTTFTNAYFILLRTFKWEPKEWSGPFQYVDASVGRLMMLPTDLVLLEDKQFAKWVKKYAYNEKRFRSDFAKAFQKLEELGTSGLTPTVWA